MEARTAPVSVAAAQAMQELQAAKRIAEPGERGFLSFDVRQGESNMWVVGRSGKTDLLTLRAGLGAPIDFPASVAAGDDEYTCEWTTALGAFRLKVSFPPRTRRTLRCVTSFLPAREARLAASARDLFMLNDPSGEVHTHQRGLRTGIFFAGVSEPLAFSLMYLQDFSSLTDLMEATGASPADTVGGSLTEAGFLPPFRGEHILPAGREFVISDVYLTVIPDAPKTPGEVAGRYLDLLAETYVGLELPALEYHDWPMRAERAARDLTLSPACSYERGGSRFLTPYVGDTTKPPESMVQLTVLVNSLEYDQWRGNPSALSRTLRAGIERFFEPEIGSIVRWLPGESFGKQSEENMNHDAMDSWYLYHSLHNTARLAKRGDTMARDLFRASLPYAIRVARRFDYQWPVFFSLKTLDIVRAESSPGAGGERDVAGLYALDMLLAHELFGDDAYLQEGRRAAAAVRHAGFRIGYQLNTTTFAAEAMLRLWEITGEREYLEGSEICMASALDNVWIWRCDYGRARYYRTFFGLFPLRDAPYVAAYEELECHAKFHEYLRRGAKDIRPSLRLLLAEYLKYSLDRCWFYYPDALPIDSLAEKQRNGRLERTLSIPLEDLQDGRTPCGSVGQEVYGGGLAFIFASRNYFAVPGSNAVLYCTYRLGELLVKDRSGGFAVTLSTCGDARGTCELRVIVQDPDLGIGAVSLTEGRGRAGKAVKSRVTVEGHLAFDLRGDQTYTLLVARAARPSQPARHRKGDVPSVRGAGQ